jgi:TadE-like protein
VRARTRDGARGQGLVEFAVLVPVFFLLLLGMLEFGLAFTHDQTLAYATREGARTGAALGVGNTSYPCNTLNFDAPIIAAVERVLESPGSPITLSNVQSIKVYQANAAGSPTGSVNNWALAMGSGPIVDGKPLDFTQTTSGWAPCSRNNGVNADSLGVSISYTYQFETPFGGIIKFISRTNWQSLQMTDKTVMNLNPTVQ